MRLALTLVVSMLSPYVLAQRTAPGTIVAGELGRRLETVVANHAQGYWGALLVAVAGKPVLAHGYGMADRSKIANGPSSLFDLGGTAEQLTAMLVLRLGADKKLRLDDPVAKHLPEWPADKAAITIDDLLRHTSGMPPEVPWPAGAPNAARTAIDAYGRARLAGAPGGPQQYSSVNSSVLALIVENVLQGRFDKLLAERLQKTFGMTGAGPCNGRFDSKLVTTRRTPENERGEPATAFELNWVHRGARGVLASVNDVHALLGALCDGKVLDDAQLALLWRPVAGGDSYSVATLPAGAEQVVRIAGQATGYRWRWIVHRASRTWIVLATEDFGSTAELETALLVELAQHLVASGAAGTTAPAAEPPPTEPAPTPATPVTADAATLERFVGTFTMPGGGGTLRLALDGGALRLHGSGLQASARLHDGAWLEHHAETRRRAEDRGLALVELLVAGDAAKLADGFATPDAARDAKQLVAGWLARHRPARTEFVGTELSARGEPAHGWFRLLGKGGELLLRAQWHDEQRFGTCTVATTEPPFVVPVQIVRPDSAVAKTPGGELRLTIEGRGPTRVLVFEDDTPGASGLLDCPLAAPR